ncbi:MAG TPA: SHOCT domain-containing protein [Acidimicrobiales bacterium]|nr:SHOCT domain-containing protein [Acidimicrobiales bacterium]
MPGLLRGVARTAVVAGTAAGVAGRVQRRQAEKFADRDASIYAQQQQSYDRQMAAQAPAPAASAAPEPSKIDQLKQLGDLKEQGILTDEEFASEKAKILST